VKDRLRQVFARVFDVPPESLVDHSGPQTILRWNSAGHLELILEIESEFNIQLTDEEVVSMVNFQAARDVVAKHV
jgi:acyl carrier protein